MSVSPLLATALVGVGGALGAAGRHAVGLRIEGRRSVLLVNALGSLALGAVSAAPIGSAATLLFGVGFCGAFTTFSSFAVGAVRTASETGVRAAATLAASNLAAALAAFVLGSSLAVAVAG
ncbi:CrcB family protein [Halorubrum ezzemoulense]|jgi:CrcB protein|uniref:Fluoride-specific ion channel FluC n=2 Tax=Halorubrum ezzemoulense TaxID=337243 RepID=A0A256KPH9_HALEZ|nr:MULTISPECIES: CrcB family protein [Halorubrum]MDB2236277.1 CrcB family protein [Halorubrum ezzemoulense]MDB2245067.1 CrcB family protein [Halorubrum ezzemoulense]MDB2248435.1 CrcB family protein [Halorubrum ezzemoulense]MDB2252553.1 CrcB family protein [Halorubrum ezzemoulense]MDB2259408.1 CrcB family protein [Halorubrum ezzemoulense]